MTAIPDETRREWLLAHILVAWRQEIGPQLRKAYKTGSDEQRLTALADVRRRLAGFIAGIDEVTR